MENSDKTILVTGATGQQGGAAVRRLLSDGWKVRAMTRNVSSKKAFALHQLGAKVVFGDYNDKESLVKALNGVYGVFSVQNFWECGVEKETEHGNLLADLAIEAGVEHFVYTSVGSAHKNTGIPHFDSKWLVEEHIRKIGLNYTILRPVFFMENFLTNDWREGITKGGLALAMKPKKPLSMISVEDIGYFAGLAFNKPEEFIGVDIDLAGDDLTIPQVCEILSKTIGRSVNFIELSIDQVRAFSEEFAVMFEWFNEVGYNVDIAKLKKLNPGLKSFSEWVKEIDWALEEQPVTS